MFFLQKKLVFSFEYFLLIRLPNLIKNIYGIELLVHLIYISLSKKQINNITNRLILKEVENILDLRCDDNRTSCVDFKYSSESISYVKDKKNFNIVEVWYLYWSITN